MTQASEAHTALLALSTQLQTQHESLNRLMDVQFAAVRDSIEKMHAAVRTVRDEFRTETVALRDEVEENRRVAEDRHLSIVKKVWMGIGLVTVASAVIEALVQILAFPK